MAKREIEGDWVMGWPDRKRPAIIAGKDSQGRVINGRAPITELEGLITPTDAYYVVNQLEVPDPIHPDDWVLTIGGLVDRRGRALGRRRRVPCGRAADLHPRGQCRPRRGCRGAS